MKTANDIKLLNLKIAIADAMSAIIPARAKRERCKAIQAEIFECLSKMV